MAKLPSDKFGEEIYFSKIKSFNSAASLAKSWQHHRWTCWKSGRAVLCWRSLSSGFSHRRAHELAYESVLNLLLFKVVCACNASKHCDAVAKHRKYQALGLQLLINSGVSLQQRFKKFQIGSNRWSWADFYIPYLREGHSIIHQEYVFLISFFFGGGSVGVA